MDCLKNNLKNKFNFFLLLFFFIYSCNSVEKDKNIKSNLTITIKYKGKKNNFFFVILNNKSLLKNEYWTSYIVKQKIMFDNKLETQEYTFFNLNKLPNYIQLRLGSTQEKLIVENITLVYKKNKLIINGADLDKYFSLTNNISFNSSEQSLSLNSTKNKQIPMIRLNPNYIYFLERK